MGEGGGVEKQKTCDMKTRKIIVEVICFVLLMNWFYEGVYKVAYWGKFSSYIKHAPLVKPVWQVLAYGIPVGEIALALMFLFPRQRVRALYITIGALMVFVLWIMSVYLFTEYLFWPYHALWAKPTWLQKMLISLGVCWVTFAAIILPNQKVSIRRFSSNSMRNVPASSK